MEEKSARHGNLATIADAKVITRGIVQNLANEKREEIVCMEEAEEARQLAKAVAKAVREPWPVPLHLIPCYRCQAQDSPPMPRGAK